MKRSTGIGLCFLLMASCASNKDAFSDSILQKRKLRKGFHVNVDLNKKKKFQAAEEKTTAQYEEATTDKRNSDEPVSASALSDTSSLAIEPNPAQELLQIIRKNWQRSQTEDIELRTSADKLTRKVAKIERQRIAGDADNERKVYWASWAGLGAGIAALLMLIIGIETSALLFLLLAVTAVVLSSRGIKQSDAAPDHYSGRGLALAGFILGIVELVLIVLAIVLIASLFSNF